MAMRNREELVGKRFLAVSSGGKLKLSLICDWEWLSGVVRAVSHKDSTFSELAILVEVDGREWTRREWIRINESFQVFLVENSLVWAPKRELAKDKELEYFSALSFKAIWPSLDIGSSRIKPVEFFPGHQLDFIEETLIKPFKEDDTHKLNLEAKREVKQWIDFQNGQGILLTTPSVLVGYRLQVYRKEGTTQWYTAVIQSYNENTQELHVTDDTVLEEHYEDPALVQMNLLGDGVVDSILRGEDIGITPRRRACNNKQPNQTATAPKTSGSGAKKSAASRAGAKSGVVTKVPAPSKVKVKQKLTQETPQTSRKVEDEVKPKSNKKRKSEPSPNSKPTAETSPKKRIKASDHHLAVEAKISVALERTASQPSLVSTGNIVEKTAKPVKPEKEGRGGPKVRGKAKEPSAGNSPRGKYKITRDQECTDVVEICVSKAEPTNKKTGESVEENKTLKRKTKQKVKNKQANVVISKSDGSESGCDKDNKAGDDTPSVSPSGLMTQPADKTATKYTPDHENQSSETNSAVKEESCQTKDNLEETTTMHYKKIRILAETKREKEPDASASIGGAELNLNHSVTDQITKREKLALNNNDIVASTAYDRLSQSLAGMVSVSNSLGTPSGESGRTAVHDSASGSSSASKDMKLDIKQEVSEVPLFAPAPSIPIQEEKMSHTDTSTSSSNEGYRSPVIPKSEEDRKSKTSSTTSSPLVFNKDEPIKVYRDPELLKKDEQVRHVHSITSATQRHHTATPVQTNTSYPTVHTPIATPHPSTLTATALAQQRSLITQLPTAYTQLGMLAGNPHLGLAGHSYNHALRGLSTLTQQQALQLQYEVLLQQQQQQQLMQQFSIAGGVPTNHLEMLWQQKYPSLPVPPPWMLLQYQEELLRDVNPVREREIALDRERREREMALEREKSERERKEKADRERAERERAEKEEREKVEQERKEKERQEREKAAKLERERVLKESAEAAAAVNAHFMESFHRLASQSKAVAAGTWTPSISVGLPKQSPPATKSPSQGYSSVKVENRSPRAEKVEVGSGGEQTKGSHSGESSHKLRDVLLKTPKATVISDRKLEKAGHSMPHHVKQEANFSLYGYQPFQHSYVTSDKLYQHGLKSQSVAGAQRVKGELMKAHALPESDRVKSELMKGMDLKVKKTLSPPPLVKTSGSVSKSSVIVENKAKDLRLPAAQYGSTVLASSHSSVIPSSAMSCQPAGSPLHVASPYQLSAEALKPMDFSTRPAGSRQGGSTSLPHHTLPGGSTVTTTTVVSAPTTVPVPVTAGFTQNLIQQGLIPNPIYSNGGLHTVSKVPPEVHKKGTSGKKSGVIPQPLVSNTASSQAKTVEVPQKRRSQEESTNPKKPKLQDTPLSLVTGPRGNTSHSSVPCSTGTSGMISQSAATGLGFMDSFRTFVENAVQSAFYSDDLSKGGRKTPPKNRHKPAVSQPAVTSVTSAAAVTPGTTSQTQPNTSSLSVPGHSQVTLSSTSSIMETINRVANGYIDTDSDTLSAESPPPHIKADPSTSPGPGQSHSTKGFKKAWLQRYSDEDREKRSDTGSTCGDGPYNLPAMDTKEDSTSSDNESQGQDCSLKKKQKRRKTPAGSNCKRSKADDSDGGSNKKKAARKNKKLKEEDHDKPSKHKPRVEVNLNRINDNPSAALAVKPLNKIPVTQLKKNGDPFMQDGACSEVTPKLVKCRECKMTISQRRKNLPNIFCRFYAFRRLRYSPKGYLAIAGFCEPPDADPEDVELWQPKMPIMGPPIDIEMAKYIIELVGDKFCELVEQEKEASTWANPDMKVAWKRAVQGVREMCDVCDTTLFNVHWVCQKCGFVVCIDCFRIRTERAPGCTDPNCSNCENVGHRWLSCSANRQPHDPEKLMLTMIIPGNALWQLGDMIHDVRDRWTIKCNCPCGRGQKPAVTPSNGVSQQLLSAVSQAFTSEPNNKEKPAVNGINDEHGKLPKKNSPSTPINGTLDNGLSPLSLLANVASMEENNIEKLLEAKKREKLGFSAVPSLADSVTAKSVQEEAKTVPDVTDLRKNSNGCSTLLDLLTKKGKKAAAAAAAERKKGKTIHSTLDDIIQKVVESNIPAEQPEVQLKHYIPKNGASMMGRGSPIPQHTLVETSFLFPEVPHSWLDSGRLLRLHEPRHDGNFKLFQKQWQRGQPVLVSNCDRMLDMSLWHPATFSQEFGEQSNDLVNCHNGNILVGHPMKDFWDGFEKMQERLIDDKKEPLILKLKDWPPTEDFAELLPSRFKDLLQGLPMPEYTHRNGVFNLASRLPEFFVKPDLGPKLYNAYGSAFSPKEGTTNLHLDVSDAVNVMVYVGVVKDDDKDHEKAALDAIEKAGIDEITRRRVKEVGEQPGALWHIFDARDADKIRDLLNKVAKERGEAIEAHHDPIHDQSWYLDEDLRDRLLKEYGVVGYSIVQCLGDAVFIPAGAPHQVRNLHSCIKAAEDFVSPEHLNHCFKLTQEFRHLTDTHSNHEDKLQVKNIIYHAVKDAVAVLSANSPESYKPEER